MYTFDVSHLSGEEVVNRLNWCRETLGGTPNVSRKWDFRDHYFLFEDEKEYMWFKLRWT